VIARADTSVDLVVLVDGRDTAVGVAPKLDVHRDGRLHRAVSVLLFDDAGRVLLQRRAEGKYHSAGLWSNTCCGHPRPDEPVIDAARRRLRAEMGIDVAAADVELAATFVYRAELAGGLVEHELDHLVVGRWTGEPMPDGREVAEWRWVARDALERDLAATPQRYTAWLPYVLEYAVP